MPSAEYFKLLPPARENGETRSQTSWVPKGFQRYFIICVFLVLLLLLTMKTKTDSVLLRGTVLRYPNVESALLQEKPSNGALHNNYSHGRLLSSFKLKPSGHLESADTSIVLSLPVNGTNHDLILHRAVLIPYEQNFPGVIATRASPNASWSVRFVSYFQAQDFVASFVQHGNSKYHSSIDFQLGVRFSKVARSELPRQFWWSQCISWPVGGGLTLAIECPMPEDAWPEMETMTKDSILDARMTYSSVDFNIKKETLGDFVMEVETLPTHSISYFLAICIAPTYGVIDPFKWVEYIEYHRLAVGVEHFYVYTYPSTDSKVFDYYASEGLLTKIVWTTRARGENLNRSRNYFEQGHMYNDCLARNKFQAKWLAVVDIDEYILVPPLHGVKDKDSLYSLLMERFATAAALQINRVCFDLDEEISSTNLVIDRRQGHTKEPDEWGTKSIVSPSRVQGIWIHWATDLEMPSPGAGPFDKHFKVPMSIIKIGHYRHRGGSHAFPGGPFVKDEPSSNVARWAPHLNDRIDTVLNRKVFGK